VSGALLGFGMLWSSCNRRDPATTLEMINLARAEARLNHRMLMVEFGASWCSDCRELATKLKEPGTNGYMQTHLDVVQVDVGKFDRNLDTASALGIDVNQGIPAAVFLLPTGVSPARIVGDAQILDYIRRLMASPVQSGL